MKIDQRDIKVDKMRGHGNGGQNRNKRETAIRVTHIPTGLQAYCQDQRSQEQNLQSALSVLQERYDEAYNRAKARTLREKFPPSNEVIRRYDFHDNYVQDNRSGKRYSLADTMDGKLDPIIEDVQGRVVE